MATQPDRRQQAAAVAAIALIGQRYDLPAIIRQKKVKTRPFRRIAPPSGITSTMGAPYFTLVRAWKAQQATLMRAYEVARAAGSTAQITAAVDAAAARIEPEMRRLLIETRTALARMDQWHRLQWIQRIKTSTGINVAVMTGQGDTRAPLADASGWAAQLMPSLHSETKTKVALALLGAAAALKPSREASADLNAVFARAKQRAGNIAVDQTDKASTGMDRARRAAAGLARFKWHHTAQKHPREDHRDRDGKTYTESRAPNDRAGTLPFCKCWEEPLFD